MPTADLLLGVAAWLALDLVLAVLIGTAIDRLARACPPARAEAGRPLRSATRHHHHAARGAGGAA